MRTTRLLTMREWIRAYYLRWVYFRLHPDRHPSHWRACWEVPWSETKDGIQKLVGPQSSQRNQPDWLFLGMVDWHTRLQRPQQLAIACSETGARCFYFNINLGRQYASTPVSGRRPRLSKLAERIYELHVPLPREPVFHERLLTRSECASIVQSISEMLRTADVKDLVIVWSLPTWNEVSVQLRDAFRGTLIYDCHDLLCGLPKMSPSIVAEEQKSFRDADLICFSSEALRKQYLKEASQHAFKSIVLPNGVRECSGEPAFRPQPPVVVFVGAFEVWLDWDLIDEASRVFPHVEFVFAGSGPCPPPVSLTVRQNVRFLGEIANSEVPALLKYCSVGIIPFRELDVAKYADPIKLYEYFAFGLPVVCTGIRLDPIVEGLIYPANGMGEWLEKLGMAIAENSGWLVSERISEARDALWSKRFEALSSRLEGILTSQSVVVNADE